MSRPPIARSIACSASSRVRGVAAARMRGPVHDSARKPSGASFRLSGSISAALMTRMRSTSKIVATGRASDIT